jgi:hypothetical protein
MVLLLPGAAVEILDPGGQNWARGLPAQPSSESLANCLALGLRAADLLVDLSRKAADLALRGEPILPVLWWNCDYRDPLCQLSQRLAGVKTPDPSRVAEIAALAGKERTLRMEIMEPYLFKRTVDFNGLANYSRELFCWFQSDF